MAGNVGNMWSRHSCVKSGKPACQKHACFKHAGFDMLCKGALRHNFLRLKIYPVERN